MRHKIYTAHAATRFIGFAKDGGRKHGFRKSVALLAPSFCFFSVVISPVAEPAKDRPLVGCYEGSVMEVYKPAAFHEAGLFKEPLQNLGGGRLELVKVEGKISACYYRLPAGRSLLEV